MRDLTVAADIAALIGVDRAAQLAVGPYPAEYRCVACRRGGLVDAGEALAVGVDVHPHGARVWVIHTACGPARIVRVVAPLRIPDETAATGVCYAAISSDGRAWACIMVEIESVETLTDPDRLDGDAVDELLNVCTRFGMQPAADPSDPPAPETITWRVQLSRPGRGGGIYARAPGGAGRVTLLEPMPPIPPRWPPFVAARRGRCGLYVASRIGLRSPTVLDDLGDALATTAHAGRLLGTTAAVLP